MAFTVSNIVEGTVTKLWRMAFIVLNIVEATVKLLNNLHMPNVLKRKAKQIGLKFGSVCLSATVKDSSQNCRRYLYICYEPTLMGELSPSPPVLFSEVSTETVLKVVGGHFLTYCRQQGYDKMLTTLGGDLITFIQNLDSLHSFCLLYTSDAADER